MIYTATNLRYGAHVTDTALDNHGHVFTNV